MKNKGQLLIQMNMAAIKVLLKPGKDPTLPPNFLPHISSQYRHDHITNVYTSQRNQAGMPTLSNYFLPFLLNHWPVPCAKTIKFNKRNPPR